MIQAVIYLLISCGVSYNYDDGDIYERTFELPASERHSGLDFSGYSKRSRRGSEETCDCEDSSEEVEITTVTTTTVTTSKPIVSPEGPFYNFLQNICKVILTKFQTRRIPKYFRVLSRSLRGLGSGYLMKRLLKRFRRTLWTLSDFNGRILKLKVQNFQVIITSKKPMADEFFHAVNSIFKIWDDNKMDDYIYVLKKYGDGLTRHIGQTTRDIFENLIFRMYYKQKERIKRDIQLKFKLAAIEYMEGRKKEL